MIAVISLIVVLILSLITNRIATITLTYTGLSRQAARFQARSALTGVGFTTGESESVVNHPVRRRVVMMLMLVGNVGVITAVSSLIIAFVDEQDQSATLLRVIILVTGLVALFLAANSKWLDKQLSKAISWALGRFTSLDIKDYAGLLHLAGEYSIAEFHVDEKDWLADQSLGDLALPEEGIIVLGIVRTDGSFFGVPDKDTLLRAEETLIIYGRQSSFERLWQRRKDLGGEWDRREAVQEQRRVARTEKEREERSEEEERVSDSQEES